MVLIDSDLKLVKSANSVGGVDSLGGAMTNTVITDVKQSLWDIVKDTELSGTVVGEYEYRCVYARNYSPTNETMEDCYFWIEQNTASPYTDIDVAVGSAPAGNDEQTITNEDTPPKSVFWTFALDETEAQYLGSIPVNQGKSIWIRRHAGPARSGSSYQADNYILMFKVRKSIGSGGGGPGPGPGPPAGQDPFGLKMIYATNTASAASAPMYMNMNDPYSDCRFMTNFPATRNQDGSYSMGASTRIRLFTSGTAGCVRDVIYNATLDTYDHDIWGQRGYMYQPNDWKNVEITGYFKCITVDPADLDRKLYLYSRGLRHNTTVGGGCSGTAYKGVIYGTDGELKWHKESFHNGSESCGDRNIESFKTGIPRTDNNEWFGMKVMMWNYNDPTTNLKKVHLELWLDINGSNQWIKQGERNDTGGWYPGAPDTTCPGDEYCGGHQDQIILWGGPSTEFRWDSGFTNVAFKWLSCREIIPGEVVVIPPPPGPEPPVTPPTGLDVFGIKNIYTSKSGGSSWASVPWANGNAREFGDPGNCVDDPDDSRFAVNDAGDPHIEIDGSGIMKATVIPGVTGSPRIRVLGTWKNVETSIYVRCPAFCKDNSNMDFRMRTDHYCVPPDPDNFGGYGSGLDFENQTINISREISHIIGYSTKQGVKSWNLPANTWIGVKGVAYILPNGNVKLEQYIDTTDGVGGGTWIKSTEAIDDGTWGGAGGGMPIATWSNQGSSIRSNIGAIDGYLEYKKWTVREITPPLESSPGTGTLWSSTAWASGGSRTMDPSEYDPNDSLVHFWAEPGGTGVINGTGTGTCTLNGITPRIYMHVPNTNATITTYVTANSGLSTINLNIRSKHNDNCGFGGYETHFNWEDNQVYITKEPVHGIYGDIQSTVTLSTLGITLTTGVSTGIRTKIETQTDNSVKISAFILVGSTWTFVTSYTDTDANTDGLATLDASEQTVFNNCANQGDQITSSVANMYKPWRSAGNQCWIRANGRPQTTAVTGIILTNSSVISP